MCTLAPRVATPVGVFVAAEPGGRNAYAGRMLTPGQPAPPIDLLNQHGESVSLQSLSGRRVMVFFYPKANTPGCTQQACALRDIAAQVGDTVILGISPDKPEAQQKFDTKFSLGFPLLADSDHAVAEAFGVWGEKSMYGRKYFGIVRSSFLIDEKGKIAHAWYKVSPDETVPLALGAIQKG